jgi:hypothetical protein
MATTPVRGILARGDAPCAVSEQINGRPAGSKHAQSDWHRAKRRFILFIPQKRNAHTRDRFSILLYFALIYGT